MAHGILIEAARVRDISILNKMFIHSIESSFTYFSEAYQQQLRREHTRIKFLKALYSAQSCFLLAYVDNQPAGYSLSRIDGADTAFIHWMYVLPQMQGMGLGGSLLEASRTRLAEKGIRRIRLLTHDQMGFYDHLGFIERGKVDGYEGGVVMTIMEAGV